MKTALPLLWSLLIVLCCTHGFCAETQEPPYADFVVSPQGNDAWPGTHDKPFATLDRARTAVRAAKRNKDILVLIRGGYYRLDNTVVFGLEDSAPAGRTITYAACPGETPVFGSGVPLTGWQKADADLANVSPQAKGKLWTAPIPEGIGSCTTLFDGDTWLPRARGKAFLAGKRWPRTEHAKHKQDMPFPEGAIPEDAPARGAELRIVPNFPWVMNLLPLSQVNIDQNIAETSVPATYGLGQLDPKHLPEGNCWLENLVECIDTPGEWAMDPTAKRIYLWPRGERPSDTIVAPKLTELIRVEGQIDYEGSTDRPVRGLVFRGLTFTHTDHWRWQADKPGWGLQHDWEMFDRPTAMVRFRGAEDCAVEGCTLAHSGAAAIRCDLHAQRIRIRRNHIYDIGGVGVLLAGYGPGTKDVNRENVVEGNHIHDIGKVLWHSVGVFAWQSGHNRIAHNHIHHAAYTAIVVSGRIIWQRQGAAECAKTIRWAEIDAATEDASRQGNWGRGGLAGWRQREPFMHGRHNVVEFNDIHHCMQILGDGNGIYISGTGDANQVRFNYVHDIDSPTVNASIRCDDDQHGTIMHGNIIANSCGEGFIIKGANTITNNIVYNLRPATPTGEEALHQRGYLVFPYGDCTGAVIERNVFFALEGQSPPIFESPKNKRGPGLLRQTKADHNVYYHAGNVEWGPGLLEEQRQYDVEEHSIAADPLFVDAPNGDFTLRSDSPALALGIVSLQPQLAGLPAPILGDERVQDGFRIISPSTKKVCRAVRSVEDGPEPAWGIGQWGTRFPFQDTLKRRDLANGAIVYEDDTKYVEFHHADGMFVLGLDSITEYEGKFRDKTQSWPHLLMQQNFKSPFLSEFKSLTLSLEARILEAENIEDPDKGYDPSLHAAQFQIFFIIKDDKPGSPGRNDFYWHGVPLYDSRRPFHEESLHVDFNPDMPKASRRSIFTPSSDAYFTEHVSLHEGRWVKIEADLLPLIREGLAKAKAKGAFAQSPDTLDAYRITHINIGWEMPGLAKVKGAIRNLSLRGEPK